MSSVEMEEGEIRDLGTCEMIAPTGLPPIAVVPNGDPAAFHVGDEVRVNGQRGRVVRVIDMSKVGVPTPWVGLAIRVEGEG